MALSSLKAYALAAVLLAGATCLSWGLWNQGRVNTLTAQNSSLEDRLEASEGLVETLQKDAIKRARTDAKQAATRALAQRTMQESLDALRKEGATDASTTCVLPASRVDRLRRLTEAANNEIRTSSELH